MPHQNTVFRDVSKTLPWAAIDRLVAEHRADAGVRTFHTKEMLLTVLFAQLSEAKSLRDIEAILASQDAGRYHSGLPRVKRSTLADAFRARPVAVFTAILAVLIAHASRKQRQELRDCVRLIDSTTIELSSLSEDWSRFSASLCGAKAHIVYDPNADCPLYLAVTPANVNDITAAKAMPIEAGATYVFDLGYYDFSWWAALDEAGCRIVSRLKSNTPLTVIETLPIPAGASNIVSDRIGFLPQRMAKSRRNPLQHAIREIVVTMDNGKPLRLMTNDLDASAIEIAALYKRRWAIELYFRWIKQTLELRHFFGTSENAVRIQIAVALIAFVLIKLAHLAQTAVESLTRFARLIRANLMHRRTAESLGLARSRPAPPPVHNHAQGILQWA